MTVRCWSALFGIAVAILVSAARADKVETGVGGAVVGSEDPNVLQSTYYAAAFQLSHDGQQALLYVQGDDDVLAGPQYEPGSTYDAIFLYRNPNTWEGLTSPYQRIKTILPDPSQGHPGWDPVAQSMWLYGHPSVTKHNGKFYLIAHKSPNAFIFQRQLWGVSSDGENFTWYPLIRWNAVSSSDRIPTVTVEADFTNNYFWGFMDVETRLGAKGIGAIRMRRSATDPRGYDRVEIWSGGIWRPTAGDGTFSFTPDIIWNGPATSKLVWDNGKWYLWASAGGPRSSCSLDSCPLQNAYDGVLDRFVYREVVPSFGGGPVTLGPVQNVTSTARCMPGKYDGSRIYPMPFGAVLYSATNDKNCSSNSFYGYYIVWSWLQ